MRYGNMRFLHGRLAISDLQGAHRGLFQTESSRKVVITHCIDREGERERERR